MDLVQPEILSINEPVSVLETYRYVPILVGYTQIEN